MILKYPVFFLFTFLAFANVAASSEENDDDDDDDTYTIGDMIFSHKLDEMRKNSRAGSSAYKGMDINWPNNTIPYTWMPGISEEKKSMIQSAMKDIMKAVPNCWKFVEKTSAHEHWVEYDTKKLPKKCSSSVGNWAARGKHPQYINFGADHCKHGSMVHELFHTMGFQHEMTRNDRDTFIEVQWDNMPQEMYHNFITDAENGFSSDNYDVSYNFQSLMHYGFFLAHAIDPDKPVMRNLRNKDATGWDLDDWDVGQRYEFSRGDLLMMARKGKCKEPKHQTYPITGATPQDVGVSEDIKHCKAMKCSKNPKPCAEGMEQIDKPCKTGKCPGGIRRLCCNSGDETEKRPANRGVHLAQSEPFNGKVFLLPWGKDNRRGDWLYNYGLCQSVGAEMVTIHSDKENRAFISFLRTFDIGGPGVWLGGQFGFNSTVLSRSFTWINGENTDYNNFRSTEPDTRGHSCLNILYSTADAELEKWWSYPCTDTVVIAACQKHVSPYN